MIDGLEAERMLRDTVPASFANPGLKKEARRNASRDMRTRAKKVSIRMLSRRQMVRQWDSNWHALSALGGRPLG